jgi:hypothetical protein
MLGRLGERTTTARTPGVRRKSVYQGTVKRGQRGWENVDSLLEKTQGGVGDAGGEVGLIEGRDRCRSSWSRSTGRRAIEKERRGG